ncbi:MAG: hypothetical protein ABIJ09_27530 [Pseudomonadota bacterium]
MVCRPRLTWALRRVATLPVIVGLGCPAVELDVDAGRTADAGLVHDAAVDSGSSSGEWLRNAPNADPPTLLAPDPGEEGRWAAARLTPSVYPFEVDLVNYTVGDGEAGDVMCSGTLAHQLRLWVASSSAPPDDQTPALEFSIPTLDPALLGHLGRSVGQVLDPPLVLEQGQHLFVAVQLPGSYPDVLCVQVNPTGSYQGDRNYFSGATAAPYGWAQLDSLGLTGSLLFTAHGQQQP